MAVPEPELVGYLQGKMADPSRTNLLSLYISGTSRCRKEIGIPGHACHTTCWGFRVFAPDLAPHAAIAIFSKSDRSTFG